MHHMRATPLGLSRDSSPEESLCQRVSGMTLEEGERQVIDYIAAIKLENCVAELELERKRQDHGQ